MPEPEDPAEATARLESALERIAAHAFRTVPEPIAPGPETEQQVDVVALAARLDRIIARLRCALAQRASDISVAGDAGARDTSEDALGRGL